MFSTIGNFAKKHAVLLMTALIVLSLIAIFHEILKPFIIALIVVYLIDPLVTWMNRPKIGKFHIPRGFAVIVAYLLFFAALTGVGFAFIPSLTNEISNASEQLPKFFMRVKNEDIPRWSEKIDDLVFTLSRKSTKDVAQAVEQASVGVDAALQSAQKEMELLTIPNVDTTGNQPLLVAGNRPEKSPHARPNTPKTQLPVLFKIRQTSSGVYEFLPGDHDIKLEADEYGSLTIKHVEPNTAGSAQTSFNLEREIDKAVTSFFESSSQYAGNALSFIQDIIGFIINTFVQFILVFMLAAFIAIDSPNLMKSVRTLFENSKGDAPGFDEYKKRLARGLSGVVRGQLIICCINGTLTGIGLWLFGVEFSLLLGLIAGVMSIVPIFGTIISTIPAVLLGLVQGPLTALLVLAWILLVHFIDTNFFTPKIVGSSSNLHPVIIMFALLAGQFAAGVLGLLLAVPVASMLQTTIKFILDYTKQDNDKSVHPQAALSVPAGISSSQNVSALSMPGVGVSSPRNISVPRLSTPSSQDVPMPKSSSSQNAAVQKVSSSQNASVHGASSVNTHYHQDSVDKPIQTGSQNPRVQTLHGIQNDDSLNNNIADSSQTSSISRKKSPKIHTSATSNINVDSKIDASKTTTDIAAMQSGDLAKITSSFNAHKNVLGHDCIQNKVSETNNVNDSDDNAHDPHLVVHKGQFNGENADTLVMIGVDPDAIPLSSKPMIKPIKTNHKS